MRPLAILVAAVAALAAVEAPAPVWTGTPWSLPDPARSDHPQAAAAAALPTTYPDQSGLATRARLIADGLANEDLGKWRRGYFAGGDPGKYLPQAAMARLLKDPQDAVARQFLNDERSRRETYHFAAINWARLLPAFGGAVTPETLAAWSQNAAKYTDFIETKGTENHKAMVYTSTLVVPPLTVGERFGGLPKEQALQRKRAWLRDYVRGLYRYGMGEWDSSTYLMFCLHGMLNIYDFAPDAADRAWAAAALDWYAAGYALKYTDGVFCAPNQRGYAGKAAGSISDQTGWLWWGSSRQIPAEEAAGFRYAMHPATSSWRPNRVLTAIAQKRLAGLPAEQRNSKPNYWFGQSVEPKGNQYQESVLLDERYSLGCLWSGFGGQMTRLQLVARTPEGPVVFTGGSPVGRNDGDGSVQRGKYGDGNGRYDRTALVGSAVMCLTSLPADEPTDHAFVTVPAGASEPRQHGHWWLMQAGEVLVGVRPFTDGSVVEAVPAKDPKKPSELRIVRIPGRLTGFVLQVGTTAQHGNLTGFAASLDATSLDLSRLAEAREVAWTGLDRRSAVLRWQDEPAAAAVAIDGAPVDLAAWPFYGGPFVRCADGVLTVSDGREGYRVDTTGELPVWSAVQP